MQHDVDRIGDIGVEIGAHVQIRTVHFGSQIRGGRVTDGVFRMQNSGQVKYATLRVSVFLYGEGGTNKPNQLA